MIAGLACACSRSEPERITARPWDAATAPAPARSAQLRIVPAPGGEVASVVRAEAERQRAIGRTTLVYVGATWCEPCRNFHRAAAAGELDRALPDVTMIEFDLDEDKTRLEIAGYASSYIPLFALPSSDGKASGKQIEGSVKGSGSVGDLVPRLRALLAR
jgi:thiol-disulfide isomerase/thioredoxin